MQAYSPAIGPTQGYIACTWTLTVKAIGKTLNQKDKILNLKRLKTKGMR